MAGNQQLTITINFVPPTVYEPRDPEWQEICENLYKELKTALAQENFDVKIEPEKEEHPKGGEWWDIFNTLIIAFGGEAIALATIKYLFDKLIELQKARHETERAREIEIGIGEKSFKFKGINPKKIKNVMQQIEDALPKEPVIILPNQGK